MLAAFVCLSVSLRRASGRCVRARPRSALCLASVCLCASECLRFSVSLFLLSLLLLLLFFFLLILLFSGRGGAAARLLLPACIQIETRGGSFSSGAEEGRI